MDHYAPSPAHCDAQNDSRRPLCYHPSSEAPHRRDVLAPLTAYNLRDYDGQVIVNSKKRARKDRFIHGNGKVKPSIYGSTQEEDLGLCFATFCTKFNCEMGLECPWRHHPLSTREREWILFVDGDLGRKFLHTTDKWWAFPETPVPGAYMHDKGQ